MESDGKGAALELEWAPEMPLLVPSHLVNWVDVLKLIFMTKRDGKD